MKYDYFKHDNAFFRGPKGESYVSHVLSGNDEDWEPYEGGGYDVIAYGRRVQEHELPMMRKVQREMRFAAE